MTKLSHKSALSHHRDNRRFGSGAPSQVRAILGPTNTGKTYYALERILSYNTGMIGFPLRLLARENYDRLVSERGVRAVALVTGEEKIIPSQARYFVCTVESMPLSRKVDCLVVDEIQLCGDPDRGHIFTDRLLHARGLEETLFLGSETMTPLIRSLIPEAEITTRERLSILKYSGSRRMTRLPERSAIVTFSATEVYGLAEMLRAQRGGAAVVMGALSPRTRNAQVDLFQSGDVNYLVATDAIGMGLNLDLNHVAFARLEKFDGQRSRRLTHQEIAQIAGRAGRYQRQGTFGTTLDCAPFEDEEVEAVETHRFDPLEGIYWRNTDLDFTSPQALMRSLDLFPDRACLYSVRKALDHAVLRRFLLDEACLSWADTPAQTQLLWDVCQIPDFQKTLTESHHRLLRDIFQFLSHDQCQIPETWVDKHLRQLDSVAGDIDTLMQRLAHVRTWTYIAYRSKWLKDSRHWQGRSRLIEDRLSDALHEKLLQRFVDKRLAVLTRQLQQGEELDTLLDAQGQIYVSGHLVAQLHGFHLDIIMSDQKQSHSKFEAEMDAEATSPKSGTKTASQLLITAARRALRQKLPDLVEKFCQTPDQEIFLTPEGHIVWQGAEIALLCKGARYDAPHVILKEGSSLEGSLAQQVLTHLTRWLQAYLGQKFVEIKQIQQCLKSGKISLTEEKKKKIYPLSATVKAILFEIQSHLGFVPRSQILADFKMLTPQDYRCFTFLNIEIGPSMVFINRYYKQATYQLRFLLWHIYHQSKGESITTQGVPDDFSHATTSLRLPHVSEDQVIFWHYFGYEVLKRAEPYILRGDCVTRFLRVVRHQSRAEKYFAIQPGWASTLGIKGDMIPAILKQYGYRIKMIEQQQRFYFRGTGKASGHTRHPLDKGVPRRMKKQATGHSSFAALSQLLPK